MQAPPSVTMTHDRYYVISKKLNSLVEYHNIWMIHILIIIITALIASRLSWRVSIFNFFPYLHYTFIIRSLISQDSHLILYILVCLAFCPCHNHNTKSIRTHLSSFDLIMWPAYPIFTFFHYRYILLFFLFFVFRRALTRISLILISSLLFIFRTYISIALWITLSLLSRVIISAQFQLHKLILVLGRVQASNCM